MTFNLVEAEIDWVVYLSEHGIPAVKAIQSKNQKYIEKVETDDGHLNVVVFEKARGEHLEHRKSQNWSDEVILDYGRALGKMYSLAKKSKDIPRILGQEPYVDVQKIAGY